MASFEHPVQSKRVDPNIVELGHRELLWLLRLRLRHLHREENVQQIPKISLAARIYYISYLYIILLQLDE